MAMESRHVAMIVATDDYKDPNLRALRAPANDAQDLKKVLNDPEIGGFSVEILTNESSYTVRRKVEEFMSGAGREDLVLLYFSCHGLKDDAGRLFLATADTEVRLRQSTAVEAAFVNEQVRCSPARRVVVILDCCYSGAFATMATKSDGAIKVEDHLRLGRGKLWLTSSTAMEYSFEGDHLDKEELPGLVDRSVFTHAIVQGLRTGEADRDGDGSVSVDELYEYVCEQVAQATPNQHPHRGGELEGRVVIARNPNARTAGTLPVSKATYRDRRATPGLFRVPGSFHVHIDGDLPRMQALVPSLSANDPPFPGKFNCIAASTDGPQRTLDEFRETYRHHTPGSGGREVFGAFSTTWLGKGSELSPEAVDALEQIVSAVVPNRGPVVELERVVGILNESGVWEPAEPQLIPTPTALESLADRYHRRSTFPIEIHHAIDIPRIHRPSSPPLSIKQMPSGLKVGGWFLFDKLDTWSYRSSQFADWSDYSYVAREGNLRVRKFVSDQCLSGTVHTLVEQVLGIWRFTDESDEGDSNAVPDLARWERSCSNETNFWVIAANFLGDKSPDVKNAMIENLKGRVSYTYFVRSYADVLRLGMLREELERELYELPGWSHKSATDTVRDHVRCVLVPTKLTTGDSRMAELLRSDYFLCPDNSDVGGYRLAPWGTGGIRLDDGEVAEIVRILSPMLEQKVASLYLSSEDRWTPSEDDDPGDYCIACTDLISLADTLGHGPWRKAVAQYDRILAREISTFANEADAANFANAEVVRPVRNGYLVIFKNPVAAVEWSKRLQLAVKSYNDALLTERSNDPVLSHRISLDRGAATQVLRAHGYDYIGGAVDDCINMFAECNEDCADVGDGAIVMSTRFAQEYKARVGAKEFSLRATTTKGDRIQILWPQDLGLALA
jgi:hypothetical protein